ncbi:MAG: dienelactone hydrolase family protein [Chromatiales bacterium]|nr:dienelactone hydrolase family protein [Chromatiales bacterium]
MTQQPDADNGRQTWHGVRRLAQQKAIGGVILLHGLGATAKELAAGFSMLPLTNKNRITFFIPQAPIQPVTLNGGIKMPAWFDILALEDAQPQEDLVGLERSRKLIKQLIDEMIASGVPADKIIIGGFSQGGALAMYCLFQEIQMYAGAFSWSGYIPRGEAIPDNHGTPVLLTHGTEDQVIPLRAVQTMPNVLENAGFQVQSHVFSNLSHTIDKRVVDVWAQWLSGIL